MLNRPRPTQDCRVNRSTRHDSSLLAYAAENNGKQFTTFRISQSPSSSVQSSTHFNHGQNQQILAKKKIWGATFWATYILPSFLKFWSFFLDGVSNQTAFSSPLNFRAFSCPLNFRAKYTLFLFPNCLPQSGRHRYCMMADHPARCAV